MWLEFQYGHLLTAYCIVWMLHTSGGFFLKGFRRPTYLEHQVDRHLNVEEQASDNSRTIAMRQHLFRLIFLSIPLSLSFFRSLSFSFYSSIFSFSFFLFLYFFLSIPLSPIFLSFFLFLYFFLSIPISLSFYSSISFSLWATFLSSHLSLQLSLAFYLLHFLSFPFPISFYLFLFLSFALSVYFFFSLIYYVRRFVHSFLHSLPTSSQSTFFACSVCLSQHTLCFVPECTTTVISQCDVVPLTFINSPPRFVLLSVPIYLSFSPYNKLQS